MSIRLIVAVVLLFFQPQTIAAVFTVGSSGDFVNIAQALTAALQNPGQHEVRIAAGDFTASSNLNVPTGFTLLVSGGWNSAFTNQILDPSLSIWRANPDQPVLTCGVSGSGVLELENLRITGGNVTNNNAAAGGISASLTQSGQLRLTRLLVEQNTGIGTAGVFVQASESSRVEMRGAILRQNRSTATSGQASGIGARITLGGATRALITDTDIIENQDATGASATFGAGLEIVARESAQLNMDDVRITNHTLNATATSAMALSLYADGNAAILASRLRIQNNRALSATQGIRDQFGVIVSDNATFACSDSLITGGSGTGMTLNSNTTGFVKLVNVTIAANAGFGLSFEDSSGINNKLLMNSIVHGNAFGLSFGPTIVRFNNLGSNLSSANPQFVSASDFRLQSTSPAINGGINSTALSAVSAVDLLGNPRIRGGIVDIGAYEFQTELYFANGFEGDL